MTIKYLISRNRPNSINIKEEAAFRKLNLYCTNRKWKIIQFNRKRRTSSKKSNRKKKTNLMKIKIRKNKKIT